MNMRASGASELRNFSHFHILKLLFPSIFCRYLRYFASETYSIYFKVSKLHLHTLIQSIQFPLITLWYHGAINDSIPTKY